MMRTWSRAVATIAMLFAAAHAVALDVGEPAPEIDVSEWLQGGAAKLADDAGKKVWLIVLWGTFEADCVDALPELNKVYAKHKAAGFDIVAISTEPADQVRTFLAYHKLDYRVAVDQFHKTSDVYGKGIRKLPMSWLVDKTGAVVWKGDPASGLERVLDEVIAGTFDSKRAIELAKRQQELGKAFWEALSGGKWDELIGVAEKVLAADPHDDMAFSYLMWGLRQKGDHAAFKTFMKGHVEACNDDADSLRSAAEQLALEGGLDWRDLDLALSAAKRAVELTKSADADAVETYGRVLFTIGLTEQAIEQQKKAVSLEDKDESHKQILAYYEACIAARKKATQLAPPPKRK